MIDPNDAVTLPLTGVEPRWLMLLKQAVAADPRGCTGVATKLIKPKSSPSVDGRPYGRAYISQFINGLNKKPASTHFIDSVLSAFGQGRIDCPHLHIDIALGQCQTHAALSWGQVANTGYERLDHWRACQDCLHNPANQVLTKP